MPRIFTIEEFKGELPNKVLDYIEIIELYTEIHRKALVKTKYGLCLIRRSHLLRGTLPTIETALNKNDYLKNQFIEKHGYFYNYDKVEYVKDRIPVIITCPIHGDFPQIASSHKQGYGCAKCGYERCSIYQQEFGTGRTLPEWIDAAERSNNFDSYKLYIIECWNDNERFYKIGRTFTTLGVRFRSKREMPYDWEEVKIITGSAKHIWNLEKQLHKEHKEFKNKPQIKFAGYTECFNIDIKDKIKEI